MKTILIVDDDREIASLAGLYLQNEGYHVVMRHDGEEALKAAQEDGIDLMVLDIMMPVGTPVTLLGEKGGTCITLEELAGHIGTIPQQVLVMLPEGLYGMYIEEDGVLGHGDENDADQNDRQSDNS